MKTITLIRIILLGRVFHTMSQLQQAINILRQGLAIAQSLNRSEEEARTRHRLGEFSIV